ncbi:MAG TPA: four helix bundle protein [Gemmatimonadaceae bacterium]|nr:four helix bundle protein [Gemmatimonadaceae bacterium]
MSPKNFTDLVVWKKSARISDIICRITAERARPEDMGLIADMCDSALAVQSAITQAHCGRPAASRKSLAVARGKVARLESLCEIAERVNFVPAGTLATVRAEMRELYLMLTRMRERIREQS